MARVLILSDGGATTGFGRVTHSIGDRLVTEYGHEVSCLAVNYDGDYWPTPIKLYRPNKNNPLDIYGQSRFVEMLAEVVPDVVLMLNDPYVILKFLLRNKWDEDLALARTTPVIAYMPVDGINHPKTWSKMPLIINGLPSFEGGTGPNFVPVVMTEFGRSLFPDAELIYHGVDSDLFRPISQTDPLTASNGRVIKSRKDAKALLGIDSDAFLVVRVDRNSHRKNFADTWRALIPVMKRHANVQAWFHCRAEGDQLELPQIIAREPEYADRFHFPGSFSSKRGWTESDLVAVYNAADLFVSTSWGEGFGLTLAEASACGVPIIAQNVSSITEVVGPGGILLEPERFIAVDSGQDQWLPNVPAFTDAIERLYASRSTRRELGEAGRTHVRKFSWEKSASQFNDLILRLAGLQVAGGTHAQDIGAE
jgi:glycosyltransferase involved in cell wall biosynthesis